MFVLVGSLWFAYKDTLIHLNKMGPCYRMSFYKVRRGDSSSAAESQKTDEQYRGYEPSPSPPPGVDQCKSTVHVIHVCTCTCTYAVHDILLYVVQSTLLRRNHYNYKVFTTWHYLYKNSLSRLGCTP